MGQSVILTTPLLWLLLGIGLALCLFDRYYKATRGVFTLLGTVFAVVGCAVALILDAGMGEVVTVLLVFLLLELEGWK